MALTDEAYDTLGRLIAELAARGEARLPTERSLALGLGASRSTVRRSLDRFESEGRIRRVRGRAGGAFVVGVDDEVASPEAVPSLCGMRRLRRNLNTVKGVPQMLNEQGFADATSVVSARMDSANATVARAMEVPIGTSVVSLMRLRYADGDSLSLERSYWRADCAGLLATPMHAIYDTLRSRFGVDVCIAQESIEMASLSSPVALMMGRPNSAPVLKLERIGYDAYERPVEYSIDLFRADRTQLEVRVVNGEAHRS